MKRATRSDWFYVQYTAAIAGQSRSGRDHLALGGLLARRWPPRYKVLSGPARAPILFGGPEMSSIHHCAGSLHRLRHPVTRERPFHACVACEEKSGWSASPGLLQGLMLSSQICGLRRMWRRRIESQFSGGAFLVRTGCAAGRRRGGNAGGDVPRRSLPRLQPPTLGRVKFTRVQVVSTSWSELLRTSRCLSICSRRLDQAGLTATDETTDPVWSENCP